MGVGHASSKPNGILLLGVSGEGKSDNRQATARGVREFQRARRRSGKIPSSDFTVLDEAAGFGFDFACRVPLVARAQVEIGDARGRIRRAC